MEEITAVLDRVACDLRSVLSGDGLAGLSAADRLVVLDRLGQVSRLVDAGVVEAVAGAEVTFAHEHGCRNLNELLQRMLRVDARGAAVLARAAGRVCRDMSLLSGERMPAEFPALRDALLDGHLTVAGMLAATDPLIKARPRIDTEGRLWADGILAGYAAGIHPAPGGGTVSGPAMGAEDLRRAASILTDALDPDGAAPSDEDAANRRHVSVGRLRDGVHPIRGNLLPEVAAVLRDILDAYNNPKVGGAPPPGVTFTPTDDAADAEGVGAEGGDEWNEDPWRMIDPRTPGQKRHDALAAALGIAARHRDMPSHAGAAPTLVVHVDVKDLASGRGFAHLGPEHTPVSVGVAAHTGCVGTIQRVLFDEGRIIGNTTTDRVFTIHQRRAIIARDKECLIPGCHVPASWCEIHHVTEYARGGPTSTDNGVPLCWWHHRALGSTGWEIRMHNGIPQIRGPEWWDPQRQWRTPCPSIPETPQRAGPFC